MSAGFRARYPGRCAACGQGFSEGDLVSYTEDDTLIGRECCAGTELDEPELSPASSRSTIIQTMPRNRTIKDRCSRCFQIPSSNNTCGCD